MRPIDRWNELKHEEFDKILVLIARGDIKCGRYAHLVKIKESDNVKGKELFADDKNKSK